jgi:hypothetical protein
MTRGVPKGRQILWFAGQSSWRFDLIKCKYNEALGA